MKLLCFQSENAVRTFVCYILSTVLLKEANLLGFVLEENEEKTGSFGPDQF